MALGAFHFLVQSSQRILCLAVVELIRLLPIDNIMALRAIRAELPFVRILVAAHAFLSHSLEGLGQILHLNKSAHFSGNMGGRVALFAGQACVLVHEGIAGLFVIELLLRRFPMDEWKILAVMFEMASHAILAIGILHPEFRVVPVIGGEIPGNFLMAFQTFECRCLGPKLVAGRALRRAVQGVMSFCKRAWRDLSFHAKGSQQKSGYKQGRKAEQTCQAGKPARSTPQVWSAVEQQAPPSAILEPPYAWAPSFKVTIGALMSRDKVIQVCP